MGALEVDPSLLPSRIATLVHSHFDALPKRSKPVVRGDGTAEWIPMTGIVLVKAQNTLLEKLTCIALATGAKCLAASRIPHCNGLVLHDCHAEILAMRAFNHWILSECHSLLAQTRHSFQDTKSEGNDISSPYIRRRSEADLKRGADPPFEIQPDVQIYMYCTCAPCGDASMELCMAAQDDSTPWTSPPGDKILDTPSGADTNTPNAAAQLLAGRGDFSKLGIVRRKPARADAESTKSKSCSDKIALRQVSSLLSYEASLLVAPTENAYIAALVLPEEEITRVGCARCFGEDGRMKELKGRAWPVTQDSSLDGNESWYRYYFRPFQILSIPTEQLKALWPFRKPRASDIDTDKQYSDEMPRPESAAMRKSKPSNLSAIWVRAPSVKRPVDTEGTASAWLADTVSKSLPTLRGSETGLFENIMNGVKQGNKASSPGLRGASALSRAKSWSYCKEIMEYISQLPGEGSSPEDGSTRRGVGAYSSVLQASTYRGFKGPRTLTDTIRARKIAIQSAREVLEGWVPNSGDEDWGLDVLVDSKKRKR